MADYGIDNALNDYVITSMSHQVITRVYRGMQVESTQRAWSITGPYGAGKSSALLFLAQVLGYPANTQIRQTIKHQYSTLLPELSDDQPAMESSGYVIVPLIGSRSPLSLTLLEGLIDTLSELPTPSSALKKHLKALRATRNQTARRQAVTVSRLEQLILETCNVLRKQSPGILGMILVFDELGKSLEYAAMYPEQVDIGLLQTLAELASRSGDTPIGLITILHQAFEHYAVDLSPVQQREWAKIQGRFEDIGFLETSEEMLGIIERAIRNTATVPSALQQMIDDEVDVSDKLGLLAKSSDPARMKWMLSGCVPLHPTVTLTLSRLFRSRLSQNERSLFAFLSSSEAHGFQAYLHTEQWLNNEYRPFYRLDGLYDYIVTTMGSLLYIQTQAKNWAEIEDAIDRLPEEATVVECKLIKVIGLLGILGDQQYLKASAPILTYALNDGSICTPDNIQQALDHLKALRIVTYRRFSNAFSLWQGSDINLNVRFDEGQAKIDRTQRLSNLLMSRGNLKPYLAKRHLYETGTFRYFDVWIIDIEDLESVKVRPFGEADGAIVFVFGTNGTPMSLLKEELSAYSASLPSPRRELLMFAIPNATKRIRMAFEETMIWQWVVDNTPGLEGDSIARRELTARQLAANRRLKRAISQCFDLSSSYRASQWIYNGGEITFASARAMISTFSSICDRVYDQAPVVQNELVNRRALSSAAAAARRQLVELMLKQAAQPNLGIEKYPPELSLYLCRIS